MGLWWGVDHQIYTAAEGRLLSSNRYLELLQAGLLLYDDSAIHFHSFGLLW